MFFVFNREKKFEFIVKTYVFDHFVYAARAASILQEHNGNGKLNEEKTSRVSIFLMLWKK